MPTWPRLLRAGFRAAGVEVTARVPRNFPHLRRADLIRDEQVDVILDIGASDGAWAQGIRSLGFSGRIISFEPLDDPPLLDGAWAWHRLALGRSPGKATLRVAANRQSSSLFPMAEAHLRAAPESTEIGTREVERARLDDLGVVRRGDRAYMKIDVQGGELDVLAGAEASLGCVRVVEAEVSAIELYTGQPLIEDVIAYLRGRGFDLIGLEVTFRDRRTGDLLQANGFFRRR